MSDYTRTRWTVTDHHDGFAVAAMNGDIIASGIRVLEHAELIAGIPARSREIEGITDDEDAYLMPDLEDMLEDILPPDPCDDDYESSSKFKHVYDYHRKVKDKVKSGLRKHLSQQHDDTRELFERIRGLL